ncbi:MAG: tetratricopeptide repeat protein, partial [Bryobacteraceae bacterium]
MPIAIFGLGYFFYPWGFILQIIALVHFFRRRPDGFWLWIIFLGGALGAAIYLIVEGLPDLGLVGGAFQSYGRQSRIAVVEAALRDNPSPANYEELGELYWDQGQYNPAREAFGYAIAARDDSTHSHYRRGLCNFFLGEPDAAIPDLERVVREDRKWDSHRALMFLAQAYAAVGRGEDASALFAEVVGIINTPEVLYNYAAFLKSQNRIAEARNWAQQLMEKKRTSPRYV